MTVDPVVVFYALPLIAIWGVYYSSRRRIQARSLRTKAEAHEAGLIEPASLHPVIDPTLCIGCKACLRACPEGDILGLIDGKAELIAPSNCIGHGACKTACPRGAISLVFGTATRGVELPTVGPDFATNVPGIYIAGELGGMGLIRNAVEQGRQAIESIGELGPGQGDFLDVVIVGSGPAGFSASLGAIERRMRYVTLEQDTLGGTIAHFPRGKVVMTAPTVLPIAGRMPFKEVSKEKLLGFLLKAGREAGLKIRERERVESVSPIEGGFAVKTTQAAYNTRAVLLAIGRRGTPRRLGVAGEELSKVVYRLVDPEQYRRQNVLVVGGGDSALEAALSIAEVAGTRVTLSYRGDSFGRAKTKNRASIEAAARRRRIEVLLSSQVRQILPDRVEITCGGRSRVLANDSVVVCAGGIMPTDFLKSIGIRIETKYGTA